MENKPVFSPELQKEIKSKFYYVDEDPFGKKRLFFENSGGSLRLKACVEAKAKYEMIPDCPMRYHDVSQKLHEVKANGVRDLMEVIFGAAPGEGALVTELTPSRTTFSIMRAIVENVPGKNVVTTSLEHPSAYDALKIYAEKRGMEFRVAQANPKTGGVDVDDILSLVDKDTCVLSVMSASNISGYVFPMKEIITRARPSNQICMWFPMRSSTSPIRPSTPMIWASMPWSSPPIRPLASGAAAMAMFPTGQQSCPMTNWKARTPRNGSWGPIPMGISQP